MPGRARIFALLALAAAPAASADPAQLERTYLERSAIAAADAGCGLFSQAERLALKSGLYQAEGELLRAGYTRERLKRLTSEVAAHTRTLGCHHPSVVDVAGQIRASYRQFAKTKFLDYPAGANTWSASRSEHDAWAVSQTDRATGLVIGLRRGETFSDLTFAVGVPAKGRAPASVRLVLRDANKMAEPWLGSLFGAAKLAPAPRAISRPEWAGEVETYENAAGESYYVFTFSQPAIDRLERLDPREAAQIEITPSPLSKDQAPITVMFEVGDLRAARAFAMIPKIEASTLAISAAAASAGH